jgi:hypothetical protein
MKHGGGPYFKGNMADKGIPKNRWNVGVGSSLLGGPVGTQMSPSVRNSNHDLRKRQPISKVYKNGDGQSKVV